MKILLVYNARAGHKRAGKHLEQVKSLLQEKDIEFDLHLTNAPGHGREIVENAFSNRTVVRKSVELKPHDWLQASDFTQPVLSGAPYRDTSRTQPGISRLIKLLTKT